MACTFINAMRVKPADESFFLAMWDEGAAYMAERPGFIATSLHKTAALNDEFQYYTIAVWRRQADLLAATSSDWWTDFVRRFGFTGEAPRFSSVPALCHVARDQQGLFARALA